MATNAPPWRPQSPLRPPSSVRPLIVKVRGPKSEEPNNQAELKKQLDGLPRDTKYLSIEEDTPSDQEWSLLGEHFTSVENLELESGFNEDLNDKHIPLHWPLQRLQLSSACGELTQTPFVRQGRVSHLSLYLTFQLRFEGPTSAELTRMHREAVEKGEKQKRYASEESKLQIIYLPDLVADCMNKAYSDPDRKPDPENEPPAGPVNLKTLEIWGNDALDTFCRMGAALPHIVDNVETLRLRSTQGNDFELLQEEVFSQMLPELHNLQTLHLTIGEVFQDESLLPTLYKAFPPNLTALYFRGPALLTQSEQWNGWLEAFASPEFLPKLQRLAFVLDLHYKDKKEAKVPDELLRQAREACEPIYEAALQRGITLEAMPAEPR